jgi:hypothetical protein
MINTVSAWFDNTPSRLLKGGAEHPAPRPDKPRQNRQRIALAAGSAGCLTQANPRIEL